jgi:hypothetical protein
METGWTALVETHHGSHEWECGEECGSACGSIVCVRTAAAQGISDLSSMWDAALRGKPDAFLAACDRGDLRTATRLLARALRGAAICA